jgi:hypothetical protein
MQGWQTPYLVLRDLPRELTEFELQAFFSFSRAELELIARRRGDNHKLGLALHIGFVLMSGRPLNSVRAVPTVLLCHVGQMLDIETPDLASLRADDELHLAPLAADDENPEVTKPRARLDQRLGEVQLPEVILAHGTSLTAAECARMIPQLSAPGTRQAMRWAGDGA